MRYVVAGGWTTGTTAAQQLRKLDPSAEIVIVDAEPVPYYGRPDLIDYIAGRKSRDQLFMHDAAWYAENALALMSGRRLVAAEPAEHRITLDDGAILSYDRLLLANGASPFVPPVPGRELPGVLTLRTLDDADNVLANIRPGETAVVIGGGVLGLEVARAITERGMSATVVEFASRLLPNQLDEYGASLLVEHLKTLNITPIAAAESEKILEGEKGAAGVVLKDGRVLPGSFVLFSIGVRPNILIAQQAGIDTGRGVKVNDFMQTSAPDIYAAGDVAEHRGRVYGVIPPCLEQARIAAQNMVSPGSATYEGSVMSSSLKTCGVDVLSMGLVNPSPEQNVEVITAKGTATYRKVVLDQGTIVGAILYGTTIGAQPLQRAMRAHAKLDQFRERLRDPDWDLSGIQ